jgi:hypothetical protein
VQTPEEFLLRLAELAPRTRSLSLRKTWHGLHFALTGTASEGKQPLSFLVAGGKTVTAEGDEEDGAYVPPRVLPPTFVKKLGMALGAITVREFADRFDLARLSKEEVYPRIWDESSTVLLREYQEAFEAVQRFVLASVERGDAIVVELTS